MAKRMRGGFNSETKNDIVRIFFLLLVLALIAGLIIALLMMAEEREGVPEPHEKTNTTRPLIGGCAGTEFGCCPDGKTSKRSVNDPCV